MTRSTALFHRATAAFTAAGMLACRHYREFAIAGVSGRGHITLTVMVVLFLVALRGRLGTDADVARDNSLTPVPDD